MRNRVLRVLLLAAVLSVPITAAASEGGHGTGPEVWLILAAILLIAKIGGEVALRLKQPPVLGELCAGIVLGNLKLFGIDMFAAAPTMPSIEFLAELGVVLLLFEVGLESTLVEMKKVAPTSGMVAIIGVVAPMALGYFTGVVLLPEESFSLHLFIGATLCATSVGITARVLKDLDVMDRTETRVILGAAVIDDVLGLIVLAVVASIARSTGASDAANLNITSELAIITAKAAVFLIGSAMLGAYLMPGVFRAASKLRTTGVLAAVAIGLCLLLSGLAAAAGLAAIVGAFAAGLILDEVHVRPFGRQSAHDLSELVAPIVAVLAPVFFVRTGMMVDLGGVGPGPLFLALMLSIVAVIGKLVSGLGVRGKTADRWAVGIGMVPRGEVGLIFADVGARIVVDGKPLINPQIYMAVVLMVMATTIITPPWLAMRLKKIVGLQTNKTDEPSSTDASAES